MSYEKPFTSLDREQIATLMKQNPNEAYLLLRQEVDNMALSVSGTNLGNFFAKEYWKVKKELYKATSPYTKIMLLGGLLKQISEHGKEVLK